MKFLYSLFMIVWTVIISSKYTYDRFRHKKFVGLLLYKLGLRSQKIKQSKKRCIWIHATSLGETLSTKALLHKLKAEDKECHIIFSTFTTVGYNFAKGFSQIDQVIILPIDLRFLMRKLVKSIKPDLFILTESDFWLNLLSEVKKYGCPMILMGGRISDRSFKRFLKAYPFANYLFSHFDYLLLQDESMKAKFSALGFSPQKIDVVGNLKLDTVGDFKKVQLGLNANRRYITFGSTHKEEELLLLNNLQSLDDDITFIVAPRRPDRFDEVRDILNETDLSWRYIDDNGNGDERVIFVNKLGVLEHCYAVSILAIVGGSFIDLAGGHNVYEPVRHGTPVLYGPHMYNQLSLTKIVEHYSVGRSCRKETLLEEVQKMISQGRIDNELLSKIKRETEGASEKVINLINRLFKNEEVCYT
ncbi:MAG: 3-deoxy-D-manno-octulosonic acid transferase [Chlamydiia bacterium]|nr:3-deoxy-D-manno-octulosonic acid transferase [Chlamydiia bacterium]